MARTAMPTTDEAATPELRTTTSDRPPPWTAPRAAVALGQTAVAVAAPVTKNVVVRVVGARIRAVVMSPVVVGAIAFYLMGPIPVLMVSAMFVSM